MKDNIKNEYCLENGIDIFRFNYKQSEDKIIQELEKIIRAYTFNDYRKIILENDEVEYTQASGNRETYLVKYKL